MLKEFFAVTKTSVYHAKAQGKNGYPSVKKIAVHGDSNSPPVGYQLQGGTMVAICKQLIVFFPEKYAMTSPLAGIERNIEKVNTRYWGDGTFAIIALFKTKTEALECFKVTNAKPCDSRWRKQTEEVLREIGEKHPAFSICHSQGLALVPS